MNKSEVLNKIGNCIISCENCADSCLKDNPAKMATCIRLDMDCAEICITTYRMIARNSTGLRHILDGCIEICKQCAEECNKHDDQHCQDCAAACNSCVEACKAYMNAA